MNRAREMWARLARVPVTFPGRGGVSVAVSPESWMCPPGWAGIVTLDGAILAVVPRPGLVEPVRERLLAHLGSGAGLAALTDLAGPAAGDVLGPAALAYLDEADFAPAPAQAESLPPGHDDVLTLVASVPEEDAQESGLDETTSAAYVVRDGREVVAAAAYRPWLDTAAHVSLLTATTHRGRGLARAVASAAVADALRNGLLPQWRTRVEASRRVARALGFREHGEQISLRPGR